MNGTITQAINARMMLEIRYGGGSRMIEPHAYGVHKSTGNNILRCYQVDGYSSSGKSSDWKMFIVPMMSDIKIIPVPFVARAGYKKGDSAMGTIFCEI